MYLARAISIFHSIKNLMIFVKSLRIFFFILGLMSFSLSSVLSQNSKDDKELSLQGLRFRCVGPALTSGRIIDIAVNPDNPYEYYIAAASGGVWKTTNAGTTFVPIFDHQGAYSIGCVTIDPSNKNIIWVGTGENNNQRSVGYGNGVYKSEDGGKSWKNMGLESSEHIAKIIIDPTDSDIVYVASMGPLWKEGGQRGIFKSTDGGKTWSNILNIDKHTGACDLIMDPRDPNVLYAATQQRRRHVFTYVGGGPGSGVHKTIDGGKTWIKVKSGLPENMGRIGLDISPANPEYIYAIVEAENGKGGTFLSTNRGVSWTKQSGYSTSGNYYQEIICDPKDPKKLFSMNTWMHVSTDAGKSWKKVGERTKHVDNHCIWIDPHNSGHWIVGCDGGVYETFDEAKTWDFKANLPLTQFYKVSVDNTKPFYHIFGGTQDNNSMGGPSRTISSHGITNGDWYITHGGDGFESQSDPENPDIVYAQSQYGVLVRYDRKTGEEVGIQPKERKEENAYRWNWDAPLIASPHKPGRIYFAANKVFRSDDYGNSWDVISDDLTRQLNRNELKVMGRIQSMDVVMKNMSTSPYGTIVALSESPVDENLLVAGTDDGLIQITHDGGKSWKKIDHINGVPQNTYVNSVYCSHHDKDVIYAAFNHHKYGDFKPYIYVSKNGGLSWTNISSNLPSRGSVYAIEEDHIDPNLIFCGTEFGVFFSVDQGKKWKQLKTGLPTIAVRDIAIHRSENDLILATFGRGFYVLDDYSPLRYLSKKGVQTGDYLFPVRDAIVYEESSQYGLSGKANQGSSFYTAENLGPVALIYFSVKEKIKTIKERRKEKEAEAVKSNKDTPYPTYEELEAEMTQDKPMILFTIKDDQGNIVRKILKPLTAGLQCVKWDLRYAPKSPVNLHPSTEYNPYGSKAEGNLVKPGKYLVTMTKFVDGKFEEIGTQNIKVVPLDQRALPVKDSELKLKFQREVEELDRSISGAQRLLSEAKKKMNHIKKAIELADVPYPELWKEWKTIDNKIKKIEKDFYGDPVKSKLEIGAPPSPATRIGWIMFEQKHSTSDPTETHKMSLTIAKEEFGPILKSITEVWEKDIMTLEQKLEEVDAPYTPGRIIRLEKRN